MKKVYFLRIVLIAPFFAFGQIINIPDANFKNALVGGDSCVLGTPNTFPYTDADQNNDGEIDQTEALQVYRMAVSDYNIIDMEGLQYFTNLVSLDCSHNQIGTLDTSTAPNLEFLDCSYNALTSINVTSNPLLEVFVCSYNQLTYLDLGAMGPDDLNCDNNLLTQVDTSEVFDLYEASFENNQLTSLSFPLVGYYVRWLNVSNNPLTSFELPSHTIILDCQNTNLQSLDLSQVFYTDGGGGLGFWIFSNNPYLEFVNFKNGQRCDFPFSFENCPALRYVCVDDNVDEAQLLENLNGNTSVNYGSYCSFIPSGVYASVSGAIRIDSNDDGCDVSDAAAASTPVIVMEGSNVAGGTFTNQNGNYIVYSKTSDLTLTPQFENPYYTISPASYTYPLEAFGSHVTVDFCLAPNGTHNDVEISIIPINSVRPGFDAHYKIVYKNQGTTTLSGSVIFNYNEDLLDFVNANPSATLGFGNISWAYSDLQPLESRMINLVLNVNSPTETPPVNIGQPLELWAHITPEIGDENYYDNHATLTQTVVGSFDPNDKAVSKLTAYVDAPEEYLQYTIRFQNTGTAAAENVVVKDLLHEKLDLASLQIVSTSHDCRTVLSDRKLEFIFEGINLPDSTTDEPESHGYVSFKIKALPTVSIGDIITNEANIYFDFNFPILTNPVSTVYQSVLATKPFEKDDVFTIYPNPTRETLQLVATTDSIKSIGIYNIIGQLVQSFEIKDFRKNFTVNVSQLQSGTYFVELVSGRGKTTQKFIKY